MNKLRPVHVGLAAVSAALAATLVGVVPAVRAANNSPASFVPIVPCRLADTRPAPDNVGTRATPLGPGEIVPFTVRGDNGTCKIPATATAMVSNVTAVGPTAASFVTIYPADAAERPLTSNLNFLPGSPPTPNQVTVALSDTGVVNAYNPFGTVDLIIDVVGYFQPAGDGGGGGGEDDTKIPSGTTVTGVLQFPAQTGAAPAVFPKAAPAPLSLDDLRFQATGTPVDPACDGTPDKPTAPSGKVCIYLVPIAGTGTGFTAALLNDPTVGFLLRWIPPAPNPVNPNPLVVFAWAYTAP